MFTGLIEGAGRLAARGRRGPGARLTITTTLGPLTLGESVAVDGCCLTVDSVTSDGFEADASAETLAKTTLGNLSINAHVNLERAMPLGGLMGGHMVSGHVDGVGTLASREASGGGFPLRFPMAPEPARCGAPKGSITVAGISLTVNAVTRDSFDVVVIPRTQRDTSLGGLCVGAQVNLEVDLIARYLERLIGHDATAAASSTPAATDTAWLSRLERGGYM